MAGLLDFFNGPTQEEEKQAKLGGLLAAGLGMLANNSGHYGQFGPAFGAGGLVGLSHYGAAKDDIRKNRLAAGHLMLEKQKAALAEAQAKKMMEGQQGFDNLMRYGTWDAPTAVGGTRDELPAPQPAGDDSGAMVSRLPPPAPIAMAPNTPGGAAPGTIPMPQQPQAPMQPGGGFLAGLTPERALGLRGRTGIDPVPFMQLGQPDYRITPDGLSAIQMNPRFGPMTRIPIAGVRTEGGMTFGMVPDGQGGHKAVPITGIAEATRAQQEQKSRLSVWEEQEKQRLKPHISSALAPERVVMNPGGIPATPLTTGAPSAPGVPGAPRAPAPTLSDNFKSIPFEQLPPNERQTALAVFEASRRGKELTALAPAPAAQGDTRVLQADQEALIADREAKAATARISSQSTEIGKSLGERQNALMAAGASAPIKSQRLDLIEDLLSKHDGGKFSMAGKEIASAANSMGLKIDKQLPNKEAAIALANDISLDFKNNAEGLNRLTGNFSDADRNFVVAMGPSLSQSSQGRALLVAAHKRLLDRQHRTSLMAEQYMKDNNGRLDDQFFTEMSKYNNKYPIFKGLADPKSITSTAPQGGR